MKALYYIAILTVFATASCNQKEKAEIARLNSENSALKIQSQAKDSSINSILQAFNQIETNLSVIKEKESVISVKSSSNNELSPDVKARINDDIMVINDLMAKNKKEIGRLRGLLKNSNLKIEEFEKMVAQLNGQIASRDSQLVALKEDLSKLNFSMTALNASLDTMKMERAQLKTTIEDRTNSLNTAYYLVGTKKELLQDNVVMKAGGVVGINSTVKMKQDFSDSKFQRVDIRQMSEIPLNSKKVQFVTTHPAGTYQLEKNSNGVVEKIKITNPDKFWSASKYLVVMLN
jgi:DNA repair exonuclease SbcCD ATPase subunit